MERAELRCCFAVQGSTTEGWQSSLSRSSEKRLILFGTRSAGANPVPSAIIWNPGIIAGVFSYAVGNEAEKGTTGIKKTPGMEARGPHRFPGVQVVEGHLPKND